MKKILYLTMILSTSFLLMGNVMAAFQESDWEKVSCCNTEDTDCNASLETSKTLLEESGYIEYSLDSATGIFSGTTTKYSDLSQSAKETGVYYVANNNELFAYLLNSDQATYSIYNITDAENTNFCIAKKVSNEFHFITDNQSENGSYTTTINGQTSLIASEGQIVTINPTPDTYYAVKDIKVTKTGTDELVTLINNQFTMPNYDVTITVEFEKVIFDVTQETSENGSYLVEGITNDKGTANQNISITATPNEHYDIDQVKVLKASDNTDISSEVGLVKNETTGVYSFTMPYDDVKVQVAFKKHPYTIKEYPRTGGSFDNLQSTATFEEVVNVKAVANSGYEITGIEVREVKDNGDAGSILEGITPIYNEETGTWSFTMPGQNIKIDVVASPKTYSIERITPQIGTGTFLIDTSAKYNNYVEVKSITAATGYTAFKSDNKTYNIKITNELGEDVTSDQEFIANKFKMPAYNIKVEVIFTQKNYLLAFDNYSNGSAVAYELNEEQAKNYPFHFNDTVKLNLRPNSGYVLKTLDIYYDSTKKVTATYAGYDSSTRTYTYTFKMPNTLNNKVNIKPKFVKIPAAPTTVSAKLYGYNDVKFTWSKVATTDGYTIQYKKSTSTAWTTWKGTQYSSGNYRYVKIPNLADGVKYQFKVYTYITDITGSKKTSSKTFNIYTLKKMAAPTITRTSNGMKISYKSINGASGYQLSQSTTSTGTNIISKLTVKKNKKYYYKVRAYKYGVDGKKIYGPWSTVKAYTLR